MQGHAAPIIAELEESTICIDKASAADSLGWCKTWCQNSGGREGLAMVVATSGEAWAYIAQATSEVW